MNFVVPPLIVGTAHLLTETPYSVDFAVQFLVIAGVLVLVGETAGHRAAWAMSAPFMAAMVSGILLHHIGNASITRSP
jgi:hydrogenase/urease accessory protein HupE